MAGWSYLYAGLNISSQICIPEWESFVQPVATDAADVLISLADCRTFGSCAEMASPDEICFHIPEAGTYRVRGGHAIDVCPTANADLREVRLFLLGSAWGALCYQRGFLVFHASAVCVENEAVIFCAPSGTGKSLVAACLMARGYPLVSDDLCRIDLSYTTQPTVYPSAARLKLWRDSLEALGWQDQHLERDYFRFEKYHMPFPAAGGQPVPLRDIYVLEWGELGIIRLTGRAALGALISAATYRGEFLESMGRTGVYWQQCLELVRRVSVWKLRRPRDLSMMHRAVDLLIQQWAVKDD